MQYSPLSQILASDYSKLKGIGLLFGLPALASAVVALALANFFETRGHTKTRVLMGLLAIGLSGFSVMCFDFEIGSTDFAVLCALFACSGICILFGLKTLFGFSFSKPAD